MKLPLFTFINGPSGSGKSTLAELLCKENDAAWRESFADPIRQMIWAVFYPDTDPLSPFPNLKDQSVKNNPMPFPSSLSMPDDSLHYWSHREEMIAFSEDYMKRRYGDRIFGKLLFHRCREQQLFYSHFIIDDSGFAAEAEEIISNVGKAACLLLRLHRRGCDFRGDSRSHISLPGVRTIDLHNNGQPREMIDTLAAELS